MSKAIVTQKAKVTTILIGTLQVEGLLLPNGKFAIAVSQLCKLFPKQFSQNNFTRQAKALLPKGSSLVKTSSEIARRKVNIIEVAQLEIIIAVLAKKGDDDAIKIAVDLIGLSLQQLWSDAFNIKFEKEERQQWLEHRQTHRTNYHPKLTYWLKKDGCIQGWEYGKAVNTFKQHINLPLVNVEQYDYHQLNILNDAESQYDMARRLGCDHTLAVNSIKILI